MLSIFVPTDRLASIQSMIDQEFRLNELVSIKSMLQIDANSDNRFMVIKGDEIYLPIHWANEIPPYILPYPLPLSKANLLAVVYTHLGNYEQAYPQAEQNPFLLADIDTLNCLQHGVQVNLFDTVPPENSSSFEQYRHWHNTAIKAHYGDLTQFVHYETIKQYYQKALHLAPNDEWRAFTGRHFASLLLDADELTTAEDLLSACIHFAISDDAKYELKSVQYAVWMKQLAMPYNHMLLQKIKTTLWEVMQYYEKAHRQAPLALLLIDASHIANLTDSFAESLGYINRAIDLLRRDAIPELLANAHYRKGTLLYTWAQNGNPQFLKPAMEAYQAALKVFTRDNAPEVFAEIQHHLGVIYSEIPDEAKKKGVWAAVSVSSFREALTYFSRETNPYEYARICNSYANALTKYPSAKQSDNYAKALHFYREALNVRTAQEFPYERALTLLNFLEACRHVQHRDEAHEAALLEEMIAKAAEIETLTDDTALLKEAHQHLAEIQLIKATLNNQITDFQDTNSN